MIPDDIWKEQLDFNAQLRDLPTTYHARTTLTSELTLHMISETIELLRCTPWKSHRNIDTPENREHILVELIDQFKYWLSQVQAWGFTPREIQDAFWRKSMAVRQKYSQEFLIKIDRPAVVIDIDNVLADYIGGMCSFIYREFKDVPVLTHRPQWVDHHVFGFTLQDWAAAKWVFRTTGQKRQLSPMPGAVEFMTALQKSGVMIVLITSRPIDKYPTMFDDTVFWLQKSGIPYDILWWSDDKNLRIPKEVIPHIRFAVDDDPQFVDQFANAGIRTYWPWHVMDDVLSHRRYLPIKAVQTLNDILVMEGLV